MSPFNYINWDDVDVEAGTLPVRRTLTYSFSIVSRGGGTRTHKASRPPDFKSGASASSATPPDNSGVYQSVPPAFEGAAGGLGIGDLEALQGPFGDGVEDGPRELEGGKGVEALDVATPPDAGDAGSVAGEVFVVDLLDPLFAHLCCCGAHAAG